MRRRLLAKAGEVLVALSLLVLTSCNSVNDDTPPTDVTGLSIKTGSESVMLSWTNPTDKDLSNIEIIASSDDADFSFYHVYTAAYGKNEYTVTDLYNNIKYDFIVRAVDTSGNHSLGVSCAGVPDSSGGPADVRNLSVVYGESDATFSWTNPRDSKFAGVEIMVVNNDLSDATVAVAEASENHDSEETAAVTTGTSSADAVAATTSVTAAATTLATASVTGTATVTGESSTTAASVTTSVAETVAQKTVVDGGTVQTASTDAELSDSEIANILSKDEQNRAVVNTDSVQKEQKTRTLVTHDTALQTYTVTGLTKGCSYTFTIRTYDSDGLFSTGIIKTTTMPVETAGLIYTLSSDKTTYTIAGFTGDDTVNQTITPEMELGIVSNPITVTVFSTYKNKPVTVIASDAFRNCRGITNITLPSSITRINPNAFEGCTALTGMVIPSGVTTIADGAFWNCTNLAWIVIPKSVTSIGLGATLGDAKLTHVFYTGTKEEWAVLSEHIKSGNASLTGTVTKLLAKPSEIRFDYDGISPIEFTAPQPVTDLITEAGLSHVTLSWVNPEDEDFSGVLISAKPAEGSLANECKLDSSEVSAYVATGLTNNTAYVFTIRTFDKVGNCSSEVVSSKIIPSLCTKTTADGLQYYVSEDGQSCVINGYTGTNEIVRIPSTIEHLPVTAIGSNAFVSQKNIRILVVPKTIVSIAEDAIVDCKNLNDIFYELDADSWSAISEMYMLNAVMHWNFVDVENDTTPPHEVSNLVIRKGNNKLVLDFDVPTDTDFLSVIITADPAVTNMVDISQGQYAALDLENEKKYTFTIKTQDLYGNISNGQVISAEAGEIPVGGVTSSGLKYQLTENEDAISGTSYAICGFDSEILKEKPTAIVIPEEIKGVPVTHIGPDAFTDCTTITSLSIPKTIRSINTNSLLQCSALTSLQLSADNKYFMLNADGTILYQKVHASRRVLFVVHSVSGVLDFTGTNAISIGADAINGCSSVTSIILPGTIKEIEDGAFRNCTSLKTIVIPQSLKSIGDAAFAGCNAMRLCNYRGTKEDWSKIKVSILKNPMLSKIQFVYGYK